MELANAIQYKKGDVHTCIWLVLLTFLVCVFALSGWLMVHWVGSVAVIAISLRGNKAGKAENDQSNNCLHDADCKSFSKLREDFSE